MSAKPSLLASIATTIADYRRGEIAAPTPDHIDKWVRQFDPAVQLPILHEIDHIFKRTYFSRPKIETYLTGLIEHAELTGEGSPCLFWKYAQFLNIQATGTSQAKMLALFSTIIKDRCSFLKDKPTFSLTAEYEFFTAGSGGQNPEHFIYFDDAIFSGDKARQDLEAWITAEAPEKATIHIIALALHESAYHNNNRLTKFIKHAGKAIEVKRWGAMAVKDRNIDMDDSDVLRPATIPDTPEVKKYVDALNPKYRPVLRKPGEGGHLGIFSSDTARQLLETEFLKAGAVIMDKHPNLPKDHRPLGCMHLETLGFGSLIVTHFNCPTTTPLALWFESPASSPSSWHPLFPRR